MTLAAITASKFLCSQFAGATAANSFMYLSLVRNSPAGQRAVLADARRDHRHSLGGRVHETAYDRIVFVEFRVGEAHVHLPVLARRILVVPDPVAGSRRVHLEAVAQLAALRSVHALLNAPIRTLGRGPQIGESGGIVALDVEAPPSGVNNDATRASVVASCSATSWIVSRSRNDGALSGTIWAALDATRASSCADSRNLSAGPTQIKTVFDESTTGAQRRSSGP